MNKNYLDDQVNETPNWFQKWRDNEFWHLSLEVRVGSILIGIVIAILGVILGVILMG